MSGGPGPDFGTWESTTAEAGAASAIPIWISKSHMPRLASSILGGVIMKTHDTCPRNCSLGNYIALPEHAPNGGIAERIAQARPIGRYGPAPRPPCVTGVTAQALAAIVGSGTELERISYARNCCGKRCDRSESIGRL